MGRGTFALVVAGATMLVTVGTAPASQLIDRDATHARIAVDRRGRALLTYDVAGKVRHVLVVGQAINALPPSKEKKQVSLKVDYGGGWGLYHTMVWKSFKNACRPYRGPELAWFVAGCTAPDGSYWALQSFPQPLPNLGYRPWTATQRETWLELSHWRGPLPRLQVWQSWLYGGRYREVFGRYTYLGKPIYGFGTTRAGAPTSSFGRLLYLDTYDAPAYGKGWRRENSFVTHRPSGIFCYGFYSFDPSKGGAAHPPGQTALRGPGTGVRYRLTAQGPGLLPDVTWHGTALGPFDPRSRRKAAFASRMAARLRTVAGGDTSCNAGQFR